MENKLQALVALIRKQFPDVIAIYRFGSWGTPAQHSGSDLDVAVLPVEPLTQELRWDLAQQLASLCGIDVDLVDLRTANTVIRSQIVTEGERLFCRDPQACASFENYVYVAYARLNEERRAILNDIKARGSVYGE